MMMRKISSVLWITLLILPGCSHRLSPLPSPRVPAIKVKSKGSIETLNLESYVASVLAGEVNQSWPLDALKAQAVAARTFALLRMRERKDRDYHIQNSVMDQVLKRNPAEPFVNAVRESSGLVLTINSDLAETSFHSTCGGKTTDSRSVWGRSYPHLAGAVCGYCRPSPSYNWRTQIPLSEVEKKYGQKIKQINIISYSKDGRAQKIKLIGDKTIVVGANDFRMAVGPMRIKSTHLTGVVIRNNLIEFSGRGFGHGVGLCQYGAMGMAKAGKNFRDILAHYYPGTKLKKIY